MTIKCRVCDGSVLEEVIDLGLQPWCNNFLKITEVGMEPSYPLRVVFCHGCKTAQLDYTVTKEIMFGDHTYLSGVTKSLSDHFKNIAIEVNERFCKNKHNKTVLDIGSNDGTQLEHYKSLGFNVLGVESSVTSADIANKNDIPTINAFFNDETAKSIGKEYDVINASGVFFHLEELHSVCAGIKNHLKDDGVFVVQFLYMKNIIENVAFDQIYHEHLLYYTLETIEVLLRRHNLSMFDGYLSPIHGGSIIGFVSHKDREAPTKRLQEMRKAEEISNINSIETYKMFSNNIKLLKEKNLELLHKYKASGKRIYGLGAPVKGNTLLNYFGIGPDVIDCLVERNKLRRNLFSPGMNIPVILEDELDEVPDVYYVLAWNFKEEILNRYSDLIDKGVEFYFPIQPKGSK